MVISVLTDDRTSGADSSGAPSAGAAAGTPTAADAQLLTPREMDILWGIAKGFTYGELAERLQISKQTVPVHIRNIYRKLEANNRSEAVYEASRRGLIKL
jgi:DNA-binding NarL/FixJ family response regulator